VIDPRITKLGKRLLPGFLYQRIAPFESYVDRYIGDFARRVKPSERVLDAGAGQSRFARDFAHAYYVSIDSGKGIAEWDYSRLSVLGDAHALPFQSQTFDHVLCQGVLNYLAEPLQALEEMQRVLKPGGDLLLTVPLLWPPAPCPHDYFRFTAEGIEHLLKTAGFDVALVTPVGGYFWMMGRKFIQFLSFFQAGWRLILFPFFAPLFAILLPLICYYLDRFDKNKLATLGYLVLAVKSAP
jgi:SAM-dependent methyltransferase